MKHPVIKKKTVSTKKTNNDINKAECLLNDELIIKIEFDDKNFLFNITKFSFPKNDYEINLTLEQLCKINKIFLNFESNKDLVDWIINSLKQKNSIIKFIDDNCIIEMKNPISNKEFEIKLIKKEKDLISRFNILESFIIEQNKKFISIEERLKKIEALMSGYNNLKLKEQNNFFSESDILNKKEKELLINFLPKKPKKIDLLLNSNIDGNSIKTILKKCDGKYPTLSIIRTSKGYMFGGYTEQIWKQGGSEDTNAFVFSINNEKKYNIKKPENATCLVENSFWRFGYSAIVITENCTQAFNNYVDNGTYDIEEKFELNGGESNFNVKSFEIYHVIY